MCPVDGRGKSLCRCGSPPGTVFGPRSRGSFAGQARGTNRRCFRTGRRRHHPNTLPAILGRSFRDSQILRTLPRRTGRSRLLARAGRGCWPVYTCKRFTLARRSVDAALVRRAAARRSSAVDVWTHGRSLVRILRTLASKLKRCGLGRHSNPGCAEGRSYVGSV